jgi:hypothetical protein
MAMQHSPTQEQLIVGVQKKSMQEKARKLLIVESGDELRAQLITVFSDAGYEVSSDGTVGDESCPCL